MTECPRDRGAFFKRFSRLFRKQSLPDASAPYFNLSRSIDREATFPSHAALIRRFFLKAFARNREKA
jgi:hypothetical protein